MEQRLKKQRNRLFRRVTLILTAVWLTASAVYCYFRLYSEKNDAQNRILSNLSYCKRQLSSETSNLDFIKNIFLNGSGYAYTDGANPGNLNSQIIIFDNDDNSVLFDSQKNIAVKYGIKFAGQNVTAEYGFIGYDSVRNALTDTQFKRIEKLLNTDPGNGKHYELICTRFQASYLYFIPLELKTVLVSDDDSWYISDKTVETFELESNLIDGGITVSCNDMRRNIIPKDFLLKGAYNKNIIEPLTKSQKKKSFETVSTGTAEYVFYASDNLYMNYLRTGENLKDKAFTIQYAEKVNLLQNCKKDLIIGSSAVFAFFFTIALIICAMIHKTVKDQIIQEQRRIDLTNALAHDIKTPLFVISGYAYSLQELPDEDERDRYLQKIIEQTDEINSLVHRMLELTKLESYNITLNRTEFDLYELAEEITGRLTHLPDGKTLSLTHSGNNVINADRKLIKTALRNLTDNAVKYSLPDSEIKIGLDGNELIISNESEPLTSFDLKNILQPYVRKDKSRHQKGNGLGLSIVKSICDLHGLKLKIGMQESKFVCRICFHTS